MSGPHNAYGRWLGAVIFAGLIGLAGCTPVSKQYEIHTADMTCEEANRYVHDAVIGMGMTITGFGVARPGSPGYVRASREDSRGTMKGQVEIRCETDGVHIDASQEGLGSQHEFERGIFLSVTGRADLVVEREGRELAGLRKRQPEAGDTAARETTATGTRLPDGTGAPRLREQARGVVVRLEPISGFATVLDFEANLSEAGILPVGVTITNGTDRYYEFDPRDIVLREAGSRRRAYPISPADTVGRLHARNRELIGAGRVQATADMGPIEPTAASELGDVRAASDIIPKRALRPARLGPGQQIDGFLYYEAGSYDRARITMIDVATGETEGFIVEF